MPVADPVDPVGRDPRALGDDLLASPARCPVVHTSGGEVLVTGHTEVVEVATDPRRYSSRASTHLQLPNGLDGADHARYRGLVDAYLAPGVVEKHAADFHRIARAVIGEHDLGGTVDAVQGPGISFAVRAMTAWLGWPGDLEPRLIAWVRENVAATRSGDRDRTAAVAADFDGIIAGVIEHRMADPTAFDDVTARLVHDTSLGRPLEPAEIVSVLRNWTGGDLSSMALCIGVVVAALAADEALQDRLRRGVSEAEFTAVIDELLRLDDPFVSNRRVTTCPVTLGGVEVPTGQRVRIHWTAANRDPEAFGTPDAFDPDANAGHNLVWGIGPHACPGRPLSMLELRAFVTELLAAATVRPASDAGVRATHPINGWISRPVVLEPR